MVKLKAKVIASCKFLQDLISFLIFLFKLAQNFSIGLRSGEGLSTEVCKFNYELNSTIKFYHKMSHSHIPILDGHSPFFGDVIYG